MLESLFSKVGGLRPPVKYSPKYSLVPKNRRVWNNRGGGGVDIVIIINNGVGGGWNKREGWTGLKK